PSGRRISTRRARSPVWRRPAGGPWPRAAERGQGRLQRCYFEIVTECFAVSGLPLLVTVATMVQLPAFRPLPTFLVVVLPAAFAPLCASPKASAPRSSRPARAIQTFTRG